MLLAVLVSLAGAAPLCAMTQIAKPMPCCVRSSHCAAGMSEVGGCCRMAPLPTKGQPQTRADATSAQRPEKTTTLVATTEWLAAFRPAAPAVDIRHPARDATVPIFLLKVPLLR